MLKAHKKSKLAQPLSKGSTALAALDKHIDAAKQEAEGDKLEAKLLAAHARLKPSSHRSFMSDLQKLAEKRGYKLQINSWDMDGMEIKAKFSFVGNVTILLPSLKSERKKQKKEG